MFVGNVLCPVTSFSRKRRQQNDLDTACTATECFRFRGRRDTRGRFEIQTTTSLASSTETKLNSIVKTTRPKSN